MVNEMNVLENKVAEVVALCRSLRAENLDLRQALTLLSLEKERLTSKMQNARERLDALAKQLPEPKDGDLLSDV